MITVDDAKTALLTIARMASEVMGYVSYAKPLSLTEAGKLLRIEPRVVVSPDCLNYAGISAVAQSLNALYSACWLTAADVLFKVNDCRTIRNLDRLRPNRDSTGFLLLGDADVRLEHYRAEGYKYSLPYSGIGAVMRNEAKGDSGGNNLSKYVNLSVGRLLEVDISPFANENETRHVDRKISINVRLKVTSAPEEVSVNILTGGNVPRGWDERFRAIVAGELNFIADGIFMHDIFKQRMKLGVLDKEGLQRAILAEARNNKKWGVLTQAPSLADASNMFVISTDTVMREIRPKIGGALTDPTARRKIFDRAPVMVIAEVDHEKDQVKFFVRDEPDYAIIKKADMKNMNDNGPDVMELFAAMQTNSFNRF